MKDASLDFQRIRRCIDVRRADIVRAVATREDCAVLLQHCASISRPNTGCPIVLLVFARLATTACQWLDGGLRVQAIGDDTETAFEVLLEVGDDMFERALPHVVMRAPLSEYAGLIARIPRAIAPLTFTPLSKRCFVLTASVETRRSTTPPPSIDERSLFAQEAPALTQDE